jgi:acetyltransferase-like isoleucine patch superfamily enzyme
MMNEREYKANRGIPRWWAHIRKMLSIPAKFWFGYKMRAQWWRWMGINIAPNCFIGRDCLFDEEVPELITLEEWADIAEHVTFLAHDHWRGVVGPVRVCRAATIGIGAIILPGITVGEQAVVGAGSVVTKPVPPRTIVAGNPAKPLRTISEAEARPMTASQ